MNIAERLELLMEEKGINRRQLSIAANIPYTTLDGIQKRSSDNVKLTTLLKLADYFDVSLDYLVGRGPDSQLSLNDLEELKSYKMYLEWRRTRWGGIEDPVKDQSSNPAMAGEVKFLLMENESPLAEKPKKK